jgi:flagellar export protein FliJ
MELAQLTQELIATERQCADLSALIQSDAASYCREAERGTTIEFMLEWHGRTDARQQALRRAQAKAGALTDAITRVRARLVEAARQRQIVDRLIERRRSLRMADTRRREQSRTDEAARRRHSSSGSLGS